MSESKKNKIFWTILILLIVGSVFATYLRIFVYKDYMLVKEVSCDPSYESCLVYTAEDLCVESEDADCVQNTEAEYYKIIHKKAAHVADCDPETLAEGESCPELVCEEGEEGCYYEGN
jgi:hypothetical protein